MTTLSVCSYNSHELGTGRSAYIDSLISAHDFVFIQETWLCEDRLDIFSKNIDNGLSHGVSGMDSNQPLIGRPYGDCSIISKKDIAGTLTPIETISKRICCIMYCFNNVNLLLINVYMPCDSNSKVDNFDYQDVLCELRRICEQVTSSIILLGGDFNTDIARSKSFNTNNFEEFLEKENEKKEKEKEKVNFMNHVLSDIDFTYESKVNGERSIFDHFIVPENVFPLITKHFVLHDVDNFSDHSPIALSVDIPIDYTHVKTHMHKPCISWDKATDHDYIKVSDSPKYFIS